MMKTWPLRVLAALALLAGAGASVAVDNTSTAAAAPDKLAPARARIAEKKKWTAAVDELKKVDDPSSADWNNLMGYSLRKADAANYQTAERHYNDALQIDPKHRGALEYSGELFLMNGNLPMAEDRLARLDKACFLPCSEHRELKGSIERYKAAGNKYVAK